MVGVLWEDPQPDVDQPRFAEVEDDGFVTHFSATIPAIQADPPADVTAALLAERGSRYGEFKDQAKIAQGIRRVMRVPGWGRLADDQKEALEIIANKIGRMLNGDPNYIDNWDDIAGYARLVADRLRKEEGAF